MKEGHSLRHMGVVSHHQISSRSGKTVETVINVRRRCGDILQAAVYDGYDSVKLFPSLPNGSFHLFDLPSGNTGGVFSCSHAVLSLGEVENGDFHSFDLCFKGFESLFKIHSCTAVCDVVFFQKLRCFAESLHAAVKGVVVA